MRQLQIRGHTGHAGTSLLAAVSLCASLTFSAPDVEAQSGTAYEVETLSAVGTNGRTPFWLEANRHGIVPEAPATVLSRFSVSRISNEGPLGFGYGAELVARPAASPSAFFNQLFGSARYGRLELRAGRFAETTGLYDVPLSTGSFTTSGNATPITKLVLRSTDFVPVPFTNGWAEASGYFAHGWFERDRYVRSPMLHEKHFYLRVGGPARLNAHGGIVHAAMWGGRNHPEEGDLPSSFSDYLRIVFVRSGRENAPSSDQVYVLGKHLGFWDFGVAYRLPRARLAIYRHFAVEEGFAAKLKTPEDGLLGISLRMHGERPVVSGILYEHLYTKRQTIHAHPRTPGEVSNIYNHYLYRHGYTHFGRTLGSPLLFLRKAAFDPATDAAISENNRVVAHHAGVSGFLAGAAYRVLLTHSRNYGQYLDWFETERTGKAHRFVSGPRQFSSLLELSVPLNAGQLHFRAAAAADIGSVYPTNAGLMLGLVWRGGIVPDIRY